MRAFVRPLVVRLTALSVTVIHVTQFIPSE